MPERIQEENKKKRCWLIVVFMYVQSWRKDLVSESLADRLRQSA